MSRTKTIHYSYFHFHMGVFEQYKYVYFCYCCIVMNHRLIQKLIYLHFKLWKTKKLKSYNFFFKRRIQQVQNLFQTFFIT